MEDLIRFVLEWTARNFGRMCSTRSSLPFCDIPVVLTHVHIIDRKEKMQIGVVEA